MFSTQREHRFRALGALLPAAWMLCWPAMASAQPSPEPSSRALRSSVNLPQPASAVHSPSEVVEAAAAAVDSADKMPRSAIVHRALGIFRYNPLGLQYEHRLLYRMRLSDSDSLLFKDTYLAVGPQLMVSPSLQRLGFRVHAKPIAVLELFALVEYLYFLGNFDYVQSYPDAAADFSTEAQKAATADGQNYAAGGVQVSLSGRLQAKVGPVAVRSTSRFNRIWFDTRDNHPVWFDIYTDLLTPRDGWTLNQDNDLLYIRGRLVLGVRHTWSRSWLGDAAMAPVKADAPRPDSTHRIGPIVAWRLRDEPKYGDKAHRSPTLLLIAQFWAQHPYRAGQEISRAIPWLILGYTFDGSLWRP